VYILCWTPRLTTPSGRAPSTDETLIAATDFLKALVDSGRVVLDLEGEIQEEYHRYLNPRGQPGVGDRFYQVILESAPNRVERISLPKDPATDEFVDFPNDPALNGFDRSDRKFAAAARKAEVPVATATDHVVGMHIGLHWRRMV
jgi:hypothetical protein